jgi:uncharacterized protein
MIRTVDSPRARLAPGLVTLLLMAGATALAVAQTTYVDPQGRFEVVVPTGWTDASPAEHATFTLSEPPGVINVLAAAGDELATVTAAVATLVDASLDEAFVGAPLQVSPVGLPSGTWTQRIYAHGSELLAVISTEREGTAYVLIARGTQPAFVTAINAAVGQVLLGLRLHESEAAPEPEVPYATEAIAFSSGASRLVGTLTLPEGPGPHPGIVLVSGSGAQDRDGRNLALPSYLPLRWLADAFTRHGLAVVRFDERGVGESGGDHASATTVDLAADVAAALSALRARDDVDAARVGLLGHSEGGVIAAMVAARDPEVAFVISMAGSAVPYAELVVAQTQRITAAMGAAPEDVAAAVALQRQVIDLVLEGKLEEAESLFVGRILEEIAGLPADARAALGDPDAYARTQVRAQLAAFEVPWMRFLLTHDPADDWRAVTAPVLAVFGGLDVQVDVASNRPALEAALAAAGNDDVTVVVIDDANHLFQRAVRGGPDEYLTLEMAFVPGFLDALTDWARDRVGARSP